jgi:hypothetical protein
MYIISYDIACKSLALSIIYFNKNWKNDLKKIQNEYYKNIDKCSNPIEIYNYTFQFLINIDKILNEMINPIYLDVVDLIPNQKIKDTNVIIRTSRLKSYLNMIDKKINDLNDDIHILLEYQMGPNDKSRNVCSQILYHYSGTDSNFNNSNSNIEKIPDLYKYTIEIIGPSLKNKINFDIDKPYSYYTTKYVKLYDANKNHSKDNFLYWINKKNMNYMIKDIKKKNLDDIADSVNMTLAWLILKSNYIR